MRIFIMTLWLSGCGLGDGEQPTSETPKTPAEADGKSTSEKVSYVAPADVGAAPDDATRTSSGLAYKVLRPGKGTKKPNKTSEVEVHYIGWQTDGTMFDTSYKRGKTAEFPLSRVIAGWTEGVQLMVQGEKTRFWIPEDLAYKGRPGAPSGMLVFDIELVSIKASDSDRFPAPADVAAPPADAKRTASGIAFRVLQAGTGAEHPTDSSRVKVHYTGWQTDGKTFDSSHKRGRPSTFPLNAVIPGWTEGVQLMVTGETTRFWIPEDLAYKGRPGRPSGMLVFDIELLEIQ